MKKTLYIQIDNNSLPEGCGEDVEVLDCRCINDFCSMVGDALVRNLKDENGKPLYRLINPVGRLLMDFKTANEETFNEVISLWYDYLGELLHKGTLEFDMTIIFPQTYIDWLLQNDNPYYESVGKELQKKKGVIAIPSEDVIDDVMASLIYKTSHTLQQKKDDVSFVVFSNPIIRNNSVVVKKVRFDGIEFNRYDSWMENNRQFFITDKEEYTSFRLNNLVVGKTIISELNNYDVIYKGNNYTICTYNCFPNVKLAFVDRLLSGVVIRSDINYNSFFQFFGTNTSIKDWSFNDLTEFLKREDGEIEDCSSTIIPVYPEKCNGMNLWYVGTIRTRKDVQIHVAFEEFFIGLYENEKLELERKNNSKGLIKTLCVSDGKLSFFELLNFI